MGDFGQKIKALRDKAGLSQPALAEAVAVSPGYVSRWETGSSSPPPSQVVRALAEALGGDVVELLRLAALERGEVERAPGVPDDAWAELSARLVAEVEAARQE